MRNPLELVLELSKNIYVRYLAKIVIFSHFCLCRVLKWSICGPQKSFLHVYLLFWAQKIDSGGL